MKKILVADDDPVMIKLLQFNLRRSGYEVTIAREGLSVISMAKAEPPDLAILDLMLPGCTGFDIVKEFKDDERLKDVPLIIVTGQGREGATDELLSVGADSVFTKPFSPKILIARIQDLLACPQ